MSDPQRQNGDRARESARGASDEKAAQEGASSTTPPRFRHERIDSHPPSDRLFACLTTDLTGNGRPDVVVGGMGATEIELPLLNTSFDRHDLLGSIIKRLGLETDLFWYENPGWERHEMTDAAALRLLGATTVDFEGSGRTDLAVGQGYSQDAIFWFEQPSDPREVWPHRVIRSDYDKYHDLVFTDVDDDGAPELVGLSQDSETVFYYDVPEDPRQTPWPDETRHVVDDEVSLEGLAAADFDGDGATELLAGTNVYHRVGPDEWERESVADDWDWTRVAVADLDDDGDLEIVFAEGDSPVLGTHPGRVAWFDPPDWDPHFLRQDLFNPHTLEVGDFVGDGRPDIYVAEMGLDQHDDPRHFLYLNQGDGQFSEHVVERGIPTHEASAADLTGNGRLDVIGKSYEPDPHVDVWYNEGRD